MDTLYASYTVLGATVLALALAAGPIKERLWMSEPLLAVAIGALLGPHGMNLFQPAAWGDRIHG